MCKLKQAHIMSIPHCKKHQPPPSPPFATHGIYLVVGVFWILPRPTFWTLPLPTFRCLYLPESLLGGPKVAISWNDDKLRTVRSAELKRPHIAPKISNCTQDFKKLSEDVPEMLTFDGAVQSYCKATIASDIRETAPIFSLNIPHRDSKRGMMAHHSTLVRRRAEHRWDNPGHLGWLP